jgi:hypothetical protein
LIRSTLTEYSEAIGKINLKLDKLRIIVDKSKNAAFHPQLQTARHYGINPTADVNPGVVERYERAYIARTQRKFSSSAEQLETLLKEIPEICGRNVSHHIDRRIRCDIAVCKLYSGSRYELKEAKKILSGVLRKKNDSFWGNLRMAEVYKQQGDLNRSLRFCDKAITILKVTSKLLITDTIGLLPDIYCYKGSILWSLHLKHILKKKVRYDKLAVKATVKAIKLLRTDINKKSDNKLMVVLIRACNNYVFFCTQTGHCSSKIFSDSINFLEGLKLKPPLVLDTLAWAALHGHVAGRSSANRENLVERALEYSTSAREEIKITTKYLPSRVVHAIEKHYATIKYISEQPGKSNRRSGLETEHEFSFA